MTERDSPTHCPLCRCVNPRHFHSDRRRDYFRCGECRLTFVPSDFHLSPADEKSEYDLHENSPDDLGYRKFLSRLFSPVNDRLQRGSHGLDFGCGPGPTLSLMFEDVGHTMEVYDPIYAPDLPDDQTLFDFVTASEVVEHFRRPMFDLERMWAKIRVGGILGIMTKLARGPEEFSQWHYKNDPTHVSFFASETFVWLGQHWRSRVTFYGDDVVVFEKSSGELS